MTNTKRWSKEPDRTPLQTRASSLLSLTFPPSHTSRGGKRSQAARPRPRPSNSSAIARQQSGANCSHPASGSPKAQGTVRCSSPTLEGSTANDHAAPRQQLLSGSLMHLDSLDDADFDLQDLMLVEDDDQLIQTNPAVSAADEVQPNSTVPAGAFLCQQLAQRFSEQQASVCSHHHQQGTGDKTELWPQQQQEHAELTDALTAPAAAYSNPISSPAFDGTAYIVESAAANRTQLASVPVAVPAVIGTAAEDVAFKTDHGDSFTAVDKMLEQLSVDAMLDQQYKMEEEQQQQPVAEASRVSHSPTDLAVLATSPPDGRAAPPAAAAGYTNDTSLQQQQQHYKSQQQHGQSGQHYMPTGPAAVQTTPNLITPPSAFALDVPEDWQQHHMSHTGAAASLPLALDGSASSNIDTVLSPQQQLQTPAAHFAHFDASGDQAQPFSFRALLMDEPITATVTTQLPQHHLHHPVQQQQQHLRHAQYQPPQQQQDEDLEGTPAGNYRLLQQHQQQRRQQQQLQYSQLHTAYSAPAHATGAAAALAGATSLPHSLPTPAAAAVPRATAYSQPVQPMSMGTHTRISNPYHSNSSTSVNPSHFITHPNPTITTYNAGIHGGSRATPSDIHVGAPVRHMQLQQQHPPPQQLSATQQELLALKQQLAEEKRRRKEKKKLRRMQKLLSEQQSQQEHQGQLQRQQSGLSQQVLLAASQQQRVTGNGPAAAAARGQQPSYATAAAHVPSGTAGPTPSAAPGSDPHTYTTPYLKPYPHAEPQAWRTPAQTHPNRQQQSLAGGSSSSSAVRYNQAQGPSSGRDTPGASPHASWQYRRGSSSSPHAVTVDSTSASRQHAVAQSLRQLADKSSHQQRAVGSGYTSHVAASAAAAGLTSKQSPTPPNPGHSSSTRYSPYPHHTPHSFSHSHSLTPFPMDSHPAASLDRPQVAADAVCPGFGRAVHKGVLPGVPVVLDLGDQPDPGSQTGPMAAGQTGRQKSGDAGQGQYTADTGHVNTANTAIVATTHDSASIRAWQQGPPAAPNSYSTGNTAPTHHDSCATGAAAGTAAGPSSSAAPLVSGFNQHSSMTGEQYTGGTAGGASPLSTISSGRKRSFDQSQTVTTDAPVPEEHQHSYQMKHPASPAVELQVMPYERQPSAAGVSAEQKQQQQSDHISQRQARLLQLPFNGPDLAERRDRERERTPINTQHTAVTQPQQLPGVEAKAQNISPHMMEAKGHLATPAAAEYDRMSTAMQPQMNQSQQHDMPMDSSGSDWYGGTGYGSQVSQAMVAKHTSTTRSSHSVELRPPMPATAATKEFRPRGMTLDGSSLVPQGPVDMSMPPPPPHHTHAAAGATAPTRARTNSTAAAAVGCLSPGDSGGGFGNTAAGGGFSAVLGSGNIYRTSSGKVLRMLTHPVTGKPLLLGPAVDAKSSRLGNTSLGAPAPQLFGLELQTSSNPGGSGLGGSAGSMSGLSGGASLGSPSTSSSVRPGGNSSKPRRQSNTGSKIRRKMTGDGAAAAAAGSSSMMVSPNSLVNLKPGIDAQGFGFVDLAASPRLPVSVAPAINPHSMGLNTLPPGSSFEGAVASTTLMDINVTPDALAGSLMLGDSTYTGVVVGQGLATPSNMGSSGVHGWGGGWDNSSAIQGPIAYQNDGLMDLQPFAMQ